MAVIDELRVEDNPAEHRYEARAGGRLLGFVTYRAEPDRITLIHTEVEPEVEHRGVGSQLVAATLDDVRARRLTVVPVCPFVRAFIRRHPEYAGLVGAR
ncbi:MAG: molybdenum cofactor cytidylyltransferase [Gaiellaceae bacterium]|nr:molybdenum cofactor cytidylyltransferase [Gaiellaceae bacterium]MDX6508662.1 molybdenum cofactor cytidylyltransferase [Gaiellaceae bacterium]